MRWMTGKTVPGAKLPNFHVRSTPSTSVFAKPSPFQSIEVTLPDESIFSVASNVRRLSELIGFPLPSNAWTLPVASITIRETSGPDFPGKPGKGKPGQVYFSRQNLASQTATNFEYPCETLDVRR